MSTAPHWYVIQIKTGREKDIVKACQNVVMEADEEVFVPTYTREKKFRGVFRNVTSVLFPGYIFFETGDADSLYMRLKRIPLLTKMVKAGTDYVPLYEEEEAMLRRLGGPMHNVAPSKGFIEGEEVRVFVGPLSGMEGKIKKIDRHKRIAIVEVSLLGRTNEVTVGLEIVEKRKGAE